MENIIISIVTPVYNAEKYLSKCIDSIQKQDFTSYELILIDDGSQDNSRYLCNEYAKTNKNIHFIHKKNEGVSIARNIGIKNARGKYITFVDADDYIGSKYLSSLYETYKKIPNEKGLAIQGYIRFSEEETGKTKKHVIQLYTLDKDTNIFQDTSLHLEGFPWGKLYNMSIIKKYKIQFPRNISYGEDLIFMLNYLLYANYISFGEATEYYYRSANTNSLVYHYSKYELELKGYHLLREAFENIKSKYKYTDKQLKDLHCEVMYFMMRTIKTMYRPQNKIPSRDRLKKYQNDFCEKEYNELLKLYHSPYKIDIAVKFCIKKHYWKLLDFILISFFTLRYNSICKRLQQLIQQQI